jgi:butyryl-CoA dehydrogenase
MFLLTAEQKMVQRLARDVAQREIKPLAAEIDEQERFPRENIDLLARLGFLGCICPKEYGGTGTDYITFLLALEEIAKVCGSTACVVSTHVGVSVYSMLKFGSEEQKHRYLPEMCRGRLMGFALTEPDAGSDASGVITRAERDGDHFVIRGAKMFITSAPANDFHIVIAVTGKDAGGRKAYTAFLVDKDTKGFSVGEHFHKMGMRGALTAELILNDCRVPASSILGKEGEGLKIALASLDSGRITVGTHALGIAQGAIEETIGYVNERKQFGKRIAGFQNTQFTLAELQTRADAGRLLLWRAAALKDRGVPFGTEAAMAKLFNTDLAMDATTKCVQLFGGYGYIKDYPMERMMRDAKITQIYEGTNEIQKLVIGRAMGVK